MCTIAGSLNFEINFLIWYTTVSTFLITTKSPISNSGAGLWFLGKYFSLISWLRVMFSDALLRILSGSWSTLVFFLSRNSVDSSSSWPRYSTPKERIEGMKFIDACLILCNAYSVALKCELQTLWSGLFESLLRIGRRMLLTCSTCSFAWGEHVAFKTCLIPLLSRKLSKDWK